MENVRRAVIKMTSIIDDTEMYHEYGGEYAYNNHIHTIAYEDYTGNTVTKNGIQATDTALLIHRVGAFEGDMFFDIATDTVMRYNAFMVNAGFVVHTDEYHLSALEDVLSIHVKYTLDGGSGQGKIKGVQNIEVMIANE